jgi:hypothetical protein
MIKMKRVIVGQILDTYNLDTILPRLQELKVEADQQGLTNLTVVTTSQGITVVGERPETSVEANLRRNEEKLRAQARYLQYQEDKKYFEQGEGRDLFHEVGQTG